MRSNGVNEVHLRSNNVKTYQYEFEYVFWDRKNRWIPLNNRYIYIFCMVSDFFCVDLTFEYVWSIFRRLHIYVLLQGSPSSPLLKTPEDSSSFQLVSWPDNESLLPVKVYFVIQTLYSPCLSWAKIDKIRYLLCNKEILYKYYINFLNIYFNIILIFLRMKARI